MLARPSADPPTRASDRANGPVWPWAAATIALVTVVVVATFVGRFLMTSAQQAELGRSAPSVPPMRVTAIIQPQAGAALFAIDTGLGRLVALARSSDTTCPPVGLCPTPAPPSALMILDGASGATLATTPLTGDARDAASTGSLLVDSSAHLAYAVASRNVVIFSTQNGARVGGYDLPRDFGAGSTGGATLDTTHGALAVADTERVILVDAQHGAVKATQALPSATFIDGPVLDSAHDRLYLQLRSTADGASTLASFDAQTLQPVGQYSLPVGIRLGPTDTTSHTLFLFGADGATWQIALDAIFNASASQSTQPAPLTRDTKLTNALALGENTSLGHRYMVTANSERITTSASGATLASLPLSAPWRSTTPIPVDIARNRLYLPADHGVIIVAQDGEAGKAAITSSAAIILARDVLSERAVLRDLYAKDPLKIPLLSPTDFPLYSGHFDQGFWFLQKNGTNWFGPYPGAAATESKSTGRAEDGYTVRFSLVWMDPDTGKYTYDWIWQVHPSGTLDLIRQY
jgi:hypothetical protein